MKNYFLIIVFMHIWSLCSKAQFTMIPDTAFEAKLIQLGIDSDGLVNGQVLTLSASWVINLDINNSNISDLTGIAAFTNLQNLTCHQNQLTTLDVSNNTNLRFLGCAENQLTSLNISNNTNLTHLDCGWNQLTNLNISNNTNLITLGCEQNQLTSLNILNHTALNNLDCGYNQLTNLNTLNNTALTILSCQYNSLPSLNIANNSDLISLNCSGNQLTNIDISNNTDLQFFYCGENQLTNLNVSNHIALRHFSCSNNLLTNLDVSNNQQLTNLYCSSNLLTSLDLSNNNLLERLHFHLNQINYINLKNKSLSFCYSYSNLANLVICVDDSTAASTASYWIKDSTATYTEICPNTTLIGKVNVDNNNNCQIDSLEPIVRNAIIQINGLTDTTYKVSNTLGRYTTELDSGTYTLSITPPSPYLTPCTNPQSTTIDSINDLDTVNWALQATHYCPYLNASISAPFLRMVGGGSNYTINYCNNGTAPAYGAYIEVEIDSFLTVLGTELPIVSQVGRVYTFNLDTIHIGECGAFTISVIVDTSAQFGQSHCSQVHIYPDSLCNNVWTGPIIRAKGTCNNNNSIVTFELENIGGPMLSPQNYVIIEDNLVLSTNPFTLGSGLNTTVQIPAQAGRTYRIEAQQATGFPPVLGPHIAYANIQNCNGSSNNPNIPLLYYNGNPAPWIDLDCQANIGAYDPNDKTAQQIGYSTQHYIERGTPLDYKVRFQNTGNDTAFNVVILDTISTHLDLSTLQMKSASHNYTWEIVNGRTLRVNFSNIQLVDSLTNEPLSHGFFRYEIQQKSNLPLGTVINNQAAIYFDYNLPIFTNTTFHTIGENYIPIVLNMKEAWIETMQVQIYPNPTSGLVYIEQSVSKNIQIKVLDNLGRVVLDKDTNDAKTSINLNDLPQGVYYINIQQEKNVHTHKVVKY